MISSYCYARKSDTRKKILELFDFFGAADPYQISQSQRCIGISRAQHEFCKEILFSDIASYTPLMLVNYIHENFSDILRPVLDIVPRRVLSSLLSLNGTEDYNKVLEILQNLVSDNDGYIVASYVIHVAKNSNCKYTRRSIKKLRNELDKDKIKRISNDLIILSEVFDIVHPSQDDLDEARTKLLGTPIRYRNASIKEQRFDVLEDILVYESKFKPFLDMYFTILELDLVDDYKDWIEKISTSNIYTFYFSNKQCNDRAHRWGETLLATIISRN